MNIISCIYREEIDAKDLEMSEIRMKGKYFIENGQITFLMYKIVREDVE